MPHPPFREVLIAGCGRIGRQLGLALAGDGSRVLGLRRRPDALPAEIEPVAADLTDPDGLAAALRGRRPEAVFYIATPPAYTDDGYREAYVLGQRNLIEALQINGASPAWQCFVSSTGVYGQDDGGWVDEDSPTEPQRFSGRRLLDAEAVALGAPWPATVVRFAGIYGPGRGRLLRRVREGAACRDEPPRWTNRIHEADCVGFLAHLARLAGPERRYIGVDDEPATQCTVMDWLAQRMGCPPPPREAGDGAGMGRRCRNRRLHNSGYRLRYPGFRDGYAAMLESGGTE
ncbi:SDR family oxidoreductase [Arhodomonas aquaeolei]|uniref:SDR family oxidoreductase n=1 Tax=Arhodomonas aquaeolei TaxID=2369 RepID=UPI000366DC20|nr:SDR family oxidoreductase [Arhodomonas aquaeolei]